MNEVQKSRAAKFRDLHLAQDIFVMPNAWNAGSARMLEAAGFAAIGTTSAGISFSLGLPDYEGALSRDTALTETRRITAAVRVPVSVDGENGYGDEPEELAEPLRLFAQTGAVGMSIEDFSAGYSTTLYDRKLAAERIRAARTFADELDIPFTLTARAECYLVGVDNPFEESVVRANLYREAGADCLFVPGVRDAETIAALVQEIDGPINVVMGLSGNLLSVAELRDLGVRRVSIGGSLARATFGLIRRAAQEIRTDGTFNYSGQQIPDAELCEFFSGRTKEDQD